MTEERKPFVLPENTATLVLDGLYEGVEVDVNLSVGWDVYDAVGRWMARWRELSDDRADPFERVAALREVAELFASKALRGWNLHDANGPIPPTAEGLMSVRDPNLMPALIGGWLDALGTSADPLGKMN